MILGMTFYELVWNFLIYSVAGWCVEVIFHAITFHRVINRGFLNGPVCPVYGFGVVVVFGVLNVVSGLLGGRSFLDALVRGGKGLPASADINIFLLFVIGVVFCTLVELLGGWLLDVVYHTRWWDYTDEFMNFKGYICLKFSLLWGLGIVIVVKFVQPMFLGKVSSGLIPENIGWWIAGIFLAIYVADLVVSALVMFQVNKTLKELDDIRKGMRVVSTNLSRFLGETAFVAEEFSGKKKPQEMLEEDRNTLETRDEFEKSHAKELEKAAQMRTKLDNSWVGRGGKTVGTFLKNAGDSATKAAKSTASVVAGSFKNMTQAFAAKPGDLKSLNARAEELEAREARVSERLARHGSFLSRIVRAGDAIKSTRYQDSLEALQGRMAEIRKGGNRKAS